MDGRDIVRLSVANTIAGWISSLSVELQSSNLRFDNMSFDWPRVWLSVSLNCLNVIIIARAHGPAQDNLIWYKLSQFLLATTVPIIIINIIRG